MINIETLKDGLFDWANQYNEESATVIYSYEDAGQPDVPYITLNFLTGFNRISQHDDNRYNELSTLVFASDFVAGNKINLKIDAIAMAEVVFDTDQETTVNNLISQILADFSQVAFARVSSDFREISFSHKIDGQTISITDLVVTEGASQPGSSIVVSDSFNIAGLRTFTLTVIGYGLKAFNMITNLQNSLTFPNVIQLLRSLGIAMNNAPIINDVSTLLETVFEKRYQMDIGFNIASNTYLDVPDDAGIIEDTDIEGQLNGRTVNISVDT